MLRVRHVVAITAILIAAVSLLVLQACGGGSRASFGTAGTAEFAEQAEKRGIISRLLNSLILRGLK